MAAGQLVPVNRHLWIWATMPVATSEHGAVWQMAGLALALLGVWAAGWIVGGGREDLGLSVRWRLAALFGFAAGLPLLLLLVAGRDFLARRQLEAIRQTHQGLEIRLRAIDHGFPLSRARVAWRLRQMLSSARYDLPAVRAACHRRLEQLCLDLEGLMLFVVDTRGRKLWANAAGRVRRHSGMEGMISRLGSAVLGTLNQETGSLAGHLLISVVESFSRELDLIAECSRNLGKFQYYRIGKNPSYVFHYPLYGADRRRAIAIVTGYWFHPSCLDHYLTRRLNLDRRRFPAIGIDSAQDHSDHHPFSGGSRRVYNFRYMFAAVSYRQGTVFGARPVRGRHYLATGIRPRELEGHLLVAHVADDHLRRRAARDGWRLHAGVGGWAVITVFLGWLLGRRFLAPIRTLADGVGAIARRDFRHRLPPWDDDEFGDLVIAFNRMIEGLADIEVARIVQERLFPEPRLEVGEIRFYGATRQATELGGDYLDLLPLPDGRALFLVGDVMGHGIPAALVMAMARALIVAWEGGLVDPAATGRGTVGARQPPGGADGGAGATAGAPMTPSAPMTGPASGAAVAPVSSPPVLAPEMALQYLQDVIYANIKMKRMLTALAGIVDGVEKTIRLANAGHNFPFLRRADGSIETLKLPASMPLAPRRKAGFATMTVPLAPGDGLVVYTDGFTEAPDRNGVAIGHAAAMQAAAATWAPDPAAWFAALTAWHATQARPGPQDDDITLLLVSR